MRRERRGNGAKGTSREEQVLRHGGYEARARLRSIDGLRRMKRMVSRSGHEATKIAQVAS